jgi:hypothetical protein
LRRLARLMADFLGVPEEDDDEEEEEGGVDGLRWCL